jgi:hypothetical protein
VLTLAAIPARWLGCRTIRVTRDRSRGFPRTGREHWRVQPLCALQAGELAPHARRQQDDAGAPALAMNQDLPGFAAGLKIPPAQPAGFRNAQPGGIEDRQENPAGEGIGSSGKDGEISLSALTWPECHKTGVI